jgi:hypothetical protein
VIVYPPSLLAVGGARTGIDPVNLLDVQDVNGNCYYWSDRLIKNVPTAISSTSSSLPFPITPPSPLAPGQYAAYGIGGNFNQSVDAPNPLGTQTESGTVALVFPSVPPNATIVGIYEGVVGSMTNNGLASANIEFISDTYTIDDSFSGTAWDPNPIPLQANNVNFYLGAGTWEGEAKAQINANVVTCIIYTVPGSESTNPSFLEYLLDGGPYVPWLVGIPEFKFHRSLLTDIGSFVIQNLSGDTLSRDFEKIARKSALEGALFVYRCWQADAMAAWLEVHGTLTVEDIGVDTVKLKGSQLINPSQDDTPLEIYCETCQLQWGGVRCGSTETTECNYSYQSCQSPARIMVAMNHYETNYGQNQANTALNVINRRRAI